jgi:hypothetical protein
VYREQLGQCDGLMKRQTLPASLDVAHRRSAEAQMLGDSLLTQSEAQSQGLDSRPEFQVHRFRAALVHGFTIAQEGAYVNHANGERVCLKRLLHKLHVYQIDTGSRDL